jgi:hypothetical protein
VSVGLFLGHGVKSRCGCGHDTSPPTQPQRWQGIGIRASATPDASSCTAISWLAGTDSCQEFGRGLYLHHQVHWNESLAHSGIGRLFHKVERHGPMWPQPKHPPFMQIIALIQRHSRIKEWPQLCYMF